MTDVSYEKTAKAFLELAGEQRLAILESLRKNQSKLSSLAKSLNSTPSEVFRNLERLEKTSMIEKKNTGK